MTSKLNTQPIIISLSKLKLTLLFIGSITFVGTGIWFVTSPGTFTDAGFRQRYIAEIVIVGYAAIAFFGLCGLVIFRKLFDNTPGLMIDKNGITDNSSGVSAGLIIWADIKEFKIIKVYRQKFIMVLVKNPEKYIRKNTTAFKRKVVKLNYQMYGSPITINSNSLKCSFDELHSILTDSLERYKEKVVTNCN